MSKLVNVALIKSKSTKSGFQTSRNHFNRYLEHITYEKQQYDLLDQDEITEDLFGKFGDYLFSVRKIKKVNSAKTYMSLMKTYFVDQMGAKFRCNFYSDCITAIEKLYEEKAKETNTLLADVADPITEMDLSIVNEVLFEAVHVTDSTRSSRSVEHCMHDRTLLNWDRGLIGRISEVAILTTCTVSFIAKEHKLMVL